MWNKIPAWAVRWGLIALCAAAVLSWLRFTPPDSPWSPRAIVGAVMQEPKVITKIEKVVVPGPERIRIVPKEKIVERFRDLPTPQTVQDNAAVVTAVAEIPPSPEGGTALSVLRQGPDNVATGTIEYKPKPVPFLAFKKTFGIRAGMGTGGLVLGEVYARPLRLGPVEVEARGFVTRDTVRGADFGAAVLIDWRF